jgi:hypothetical protein
VAILQISGAHDWVLRWSGGLPFISKDGWVLRTDDASLDERLKSEDLGARVAPLGRATLRYTSREGTLTWSGFIEPYWALPPEQFRVTLDTLLDIVSITTPLNV